MMTMQVKDRGLMIDEDVLGAVAVSIVKALRYLQETLRVIHRDVKPSNVLLSKDGELILRFVVVKFCTTYVNLYTILETSVICIK